MKNGTVFECFGRGEKVAHNGSIPPGWSIINIFGFPRLFCQSCSLHFQYSPGMNHPVDISPTMQQDLHKRHGLVFDKRSEDR